MGGPPIFMADPGTFRPIEYSHALKVEKITFTVRFPVFADEPGRATFTVSSESFSNTLQEYIDRPESMEAIGRMLLRAAEDMRQAGRS